MSARNDPHRNARFRLEIGAVTIASFSQATIPETTTEPVEYRDGIDTPTMRKLPGLTSYGNLSLQKGVTENSIELFEWRKAVEEGRMGDARTDIAVVLLDEEGNDAARWKFEAAWPTNYDAPDLDSSGNEVAIESLEIVHEKMERVA
jgi:phage tail-like protein